MSPLAIVVRLISLLYLVSADVSHVLQGTAHPPNSNAQAVNALVLAEEGKGASGEFWWQSGDSPLKKAYDDFKNCDKKGGCTLRHHQQVVKFNNELAADVSKIDLSKNPFFNGNVTRNAGTQQRKIDLDKNPFFSGHGQIIDDNGEGFLGVQPAEIKFAKSKPFSLTHPLSGACSANGYICVPISKCDKDGFTTVSFRNDVLQIGNKVRYCFLYYFRMLENQRIGDRK